MTIVKLYFGDLFQFLLSLSSCLQLLLLFPSGIQSHEIPPFQIGNLLHGVKPHCDVHILLTRKKDKINFTSIHDYIWPTTILSLQDVGISSPTRNYVVEPFLSTEKLLPFALNTLQSRVGFICRINILISSSFQTTNSRDEFESINILARYHLKYGQWWILSPSNVITILVTLPQFLQQGYDFSNRVFLENFAIAVQFDNNSSVQLLIPNRTQELDIAKMKPLLKREDENVVETITTMWKPFNTWIVFVSDKQVIIIALLFVKYQI
jgi:hypothetical protein